MEPHQEVKASGGVVTAYCAHGLPLSIPPVHLRWVLIGGRGLTQRRSCLYSWKTKIGKGALIEHVVHHVKKINLKLDLQLPSFGKSGSFIQTTPFNFTPRSHCLRTHAREHTHMQEHTYTHTSRATWDQAAKHSQTPIRRVTIEFLAAGNF